MSLRASLFNHKLGESYATYLYNRTADSYRYGCFMVRLVWYVRRRIAAMLALSLYLLESTAVTGSFDLVYSFYGTTVTHNFAAGKNVALTFDDGPYPPYTDELLKILEQRQVKATFFMVAENAEKHPELVAKIAAQGHEIALHALKHRDFLKLSLAEQQKDIAAGKRILEKLSGQKITLMRPPHGFRDWAVIDTLQKNGLTAVNWSVIPRDWTNPGVSVIVDRIMEQMHPGAIILLHDGDSPKYVASREETIQAVSVIIDKLRAEGYNFVTVNELMQKGE